MNKHICMKGGSKLTYSLLLFFFIWTNSCQAQALGLKKDTIQFCVMSYNVENLFDCRHDTLKSDYEFLPQATRHWTFSKYRKKLDNIARVILSLGGWNPPALVGLCEVENDSVLHALTHYSLLRNTGYRYIITHSNDQRGIDVGLLYQRKWFKPIHIEALSVKKPAGVHRDTRDVLHVSGCLVNLDTLDVIICHFPSRRGGARHSEPYRLSAAQTVRRCVDSLYSVRQKPQVIIMGDFNDYPENLSIQNILGNNPTLHHLLAKKTSQKHNGTYKFKGEWGLLDHLIVSPSLTQPHATFFTPPDSGHIFNPPFLLTTDKTYGGEQPFRTYWGMRYLGGFSDHLPIYASFRLIY